MIDINGDEIIYECLWIFMNIYEYLWFIVYEYLWIYLWMVVHMRNEWWLIWA